MKNSVKVALTKGLFAIIDEEDLPKVSQYKWHALCKRRGGNYYANTSIHISGSGKDRIKKNINMHRFIMDATDGQHVDHKNGNTLDNRKENLRICSNSQNHMNIPKINKATTSKYKGVSLRKNDASKGWRATIRANGEALELGYYPTEAAAAIAYNQAALKYFGEFALLNEIPPAGRSS
jgi:hypothetical protein